VFPVNTTLMKKILVLPVLLNFVAITSSAQLSQVIPAFGKIDVADLKMTDCSFNPGAEAIYLLRFEDVTLSVFPNGRTQVLITKRYRVKILKKGGFKLANVSVDYNSKGEKITDVEGATYNLEADGQIKTTSIDKTDIFKTETTKKEKTMAFAFPDVKEGSILEYRFTQKIKDAFYIPAWYFQSSIPNVLSVCKVSRPYYSPLQKKVIGEWPMEEDSSISYEKGDDQRELVSYYVMRNVPPFTMEPFMSTSRDYRYRVDFMTVPEETKYAAYVKKSDNIWQGENAWLLNSPYFGGQFDADIPGTKKFIDSVKKLKDTSSKIAAVYKFVKQKIKWNQYYFLLSRDLKEVWQDGEGTSAEINLSILNLLRKCEVMCFPGLYSTRLHGKVDFNFASLGQFNTVNVVVINGKRFDLLDGTNRYLSYDTPPLNVVNRTGMLVDPEYNSLVNVDFDRKLLWDSVYVYAKIDRNGVLSGKIIRKYFDLAKLVKLQNDDEHDEVDEAENVNKTGFQEDPLLKIDSTYQLDKDIELLPLTEVSIFHYELPSANDFYLLSPFLFSSLSKNPFTDTVRKTDIDFVASISSSVHMEITLPKEIKVEELSKDKEMRARDSSVAFSYHNEIKNDVIYVNSSFDIYKPIFDKGEYADLKKNFKSIYSLSNNQILLQSRH
jgi:hypothetical protein